MNTDSPKITGSSASVTSIPPEMSSQSAKALLSPREGGVGWIVAAGRNRSPSALSKLHTFSANACKASECAHDCRGDRHNRRHCEARDISGYADGRPIQRIRVNGPVIQLASPLHLFPWAQGRRHILTRPRLRTAIEWIRRPLLIQHQGDIDARQEKHIQRLARR